MIGYTLLTADYPDSINNDGAMTMKVRVERYGMGLAVGGFVVEVFLGDIYLKVPRVGELAWNSVGFFVDRAGVSGTARSEGVPG